ncbi:hypothetical protein [Thermoflavimicrobium dichotomicum]|nr:hypothetical protein [Thermoflavimicrobium dichotomicum]
MEILKSRKAKRIMGFVSPFVIVLALMLFMTQFRQVQTLDPQELKAIETYQQQVIKGALNNNKGIFTEEDFKTISKSMDRLHQYANYLIWGPQWGYKIDNVDQEFATIESIINKPEYNKPEYADFFKALKEDLAEAKKDYGSRPSHDILDDLSSLVFTDAILQGEKQWGNPKTIQLMKEKGMKMLVKKEPSSPKK